MPAQQPQLIFLVGLHGAGKTTLGRWLHSEYGWRHFSVGDIARKARRRERFSDVPLSLLVELVRQEPNAPMNERLAHQLVHYLLDANLAEHVVCDGFPSEASHLALLPAHARLVHITSRERESRLILRGESTRRIWTPGNLSHRDLQLPILLRHAPTFLALDTLSNDGPVEETQSELAKILGIFTRR
jgi:adenylate kinase family enzyme